MKFLIQINLLIFIILSQFLITLAEDENEHVQVNYLIKPSVLKPGDEAKLIINFQPAKGILINLKPPITVEIDKKIAILKNIELSKSRSGEYLDHNKPITQIIKLNRNIKPGKVKIKGNLTYYYCSEKEGWCTKANQNIELNITVKK